MHFPICSMRNLVFWTSALVFFLSTTHGGRILVGYPFESRSHLYSMRGYLERLADAGHQITILQTAISIPEANFGHTNITSVYIKIKTELDVNKIVNSFLWMSTSHAYEPPFILIAMHQGLDQFIDEHSDVLAELMNQKWDLVVVEQLFNPLTYALATYHKRIHGTPYVQYSSSHPLESDAVANGMGRAWASKMSMFTPIPRDSSDVYRIDSFPERVISFLENSADYLLHSYAHLWTFGGLHRLGLWPFSMKTLNDDSSLYMSDLFRGFDVAAEAHDFRLVGAYCNRGKKLEEKFESFVGDVNSKGTIYMAFGSMVDWRAAPPEIVQSVFGALNELTDYRIVISTNGPPKDIEVGPHVMLTSWAPQIPLLSDPRTRLFISHGGLKSVKEAICGRTPVLYLPLFAEQSHNARQMVQLGLATLLNKYTISKAKVLGEMRKILPDPRYQERADKFYGQYLDHPIPTLDSAVHLTNRIIRKRGRDLWFERKGRRLSWLEFTYSPLAASLGLIFYVVNRE